MTKELNNCPLLNWSDEFTSSSSIAEEPNPENWEIMLGDGCDYNICQWGNNELQIYTKENVYVKNNMLILQATKEKNRENKENFIYKSARIRSMHKVDLDSTAYIEARIKLPISQQGLWPAFWMLPTPSSKNHENVNWPDGGEIDIMEQIGSEPSIIHSTIHFSRHNRNHGEMGSSLKSRFDYSHEFVKFGLEKRADKLTWICNGYVYFELHQNQVESWPFNDSKFHFLLNLAVGGDWPGNPFPHSEFPQEMQVDYIRFYNAPFGKLRGPNLVQTGSVVTYYVESEFDYEYEWKVQVKDAVIVDQYNDRIQIQFGSLSGTIQLFLFQEDCEDHEFSVQISVMSFLFRFIGDFNDNDQAFLRSHSGEYQLISNPSQQEGQDFESPPSQVISYKRSSEEYDTIVYETAQVQDPMAYIYGTSVFSIDVYFESPSTTFDVILQLQDGTQSTEEYPIGRHSRYILHAFCNEDEVATWKTFYFSYLDQLDTDPKPQEQELHVDQIVLLFQPGITFNSKFIFGNIDTHRINPAPTSFSMNSHDNHNKSKAIPKTLFLFMSLGLLILCCLTQLRRRRKEAQIASKDYDIAWEEFTFDHEGDVKKDADFEDIGMEIIGVENHDKPIV